MTQRGLEVSSGKGALGGGDSQGPEARKQMAHSRNCRSIALRANRRRGDRRLEVGAGLGRWEPRV